MAVEGVRPVPWGSPHIGVLAGNRLHLQHGPIDLMIKAEGSPDQVKAAYAAAIERFDSILGELVADLEILRRPLLHRRPVFHTSVANRMMTACWPHRSDFITPMAAVAGSVADEIKAVMLIAAPDLQTFYVNNGGDIALHVAEGFTLRIGVVADLIKAMPDGVVAVDHASGIGGIATSGWRGRSFSRGIADAVTVLAQSAAEADAAATIIANAVNVSSNRIRRVPARSLDPDSDLGDLMVTTEVDMLSAQEIIYALDAGKKTAMKLMKSEQILGCLLALQNETLLVR